MRPSLLVIGHLDPTGRHGLAADLRAAESLDVTPLPVITSVVTGNAETPSRLTPVSSRLLAAQLSSALDQEPDAALIGTLCQPRQARLIAKQFGDRGPAAVVLAPVPSAFDLVPLASRRLFAAVRRHLVPDADVVVVSAPQATALIGNNGSTIDDLRLIGQQIVNSGSRSAWVRSAENGSRRIDVLVDGQGSGLLDYQPAGDDAEPHSAPAALAAYLALGTKFREAVDRAHRHAYSLDRTLHAV